MPLDVDDRRWDRVEELLGLSLAESLGIDDRLVAEQQIGRFLEAVSAQPESSIKSWLVPQWVILAAGLGTRIDPTGRLNKNLDVWFGGYNTLQLARRYLPGNRPHIIVLHPTLVERLQVPGSDEIDPDRSDAFLGPNAQVVVQPQPDGTGGALRAALPLLEQSNAEFIGVAFGDEPFLDPPLFVQTLLAHFVEGADVTLCGKVPETVVDKGGLFFDDTGRFQGTKEWYDMTPEEQQWMWRRLDQGCAYTNTGITLIRRDAVLARMDRLEPHGRKSEYHHVDLIRHCYEDGLRTHAHIYRGEITSGVNRWNNVLVGQERLEAQQRESLSRQGIRVHPGARIWLGEGHRGLQPQVTLAHGCELAGHVSLGQGASVGEYSALENVTLDGRTSVGTSVRLREVSAIATIIQDSPLPATASKPWHGLDTGTSIEHCEFDHVWIGAGVRLSHVKARYAFIPAGSRLSHCALGVAEACTGRSQWLDDSYQPGTPVTQQSAELRELRQQMMEEWIPAATCDAELQRHCLATVDQYLQWKDTNGTWIPGKLTFEQIAGVLCEIVRLCTGCLDPLWHQRQPLLTADNPTSLPQALHALREEPPRQVLWFLGDVRSLATEIRLIRELLNADHHVTLAAKSAAVLWDANLRDLEPLRATLPGGVWRVLDTGCTCLGVDLQQLNPSSWNALINADVIIASGSNRKTLHGLREKRIISLDI